MRDLLNDLFEDIQSLSNEIQQGPTAAEISENLKSFLIRQKLIKLELEIHSRSLLLPLDILLVGATGVGKSSTVNALFGDRVAKVGTGCEPETQHVSSYKIGNYFRVHDSAGLGDGLANDEIHAKNIIKKLTQTVSVDGDSSIPYGFIDMVFVILDGSGRDLGTTYQLLKNVILPVFDPKRIVIVINQADMAMKGRYWNNSTQNPEQILLDFLEEKAISTQVRIKEATGLMVHKPVFYSAEYGYNIDKVISHITENLPQERRIVKVDGNTNKFIF